MTSRVWIFALSVALGCAGDAGDAGDPTQADASASSGDAPREDAGEVPGVTPRNADATQSNPFGASDHFYGADTSSWAEFLDQFASASCGDRFFFERGGSWDVGPRLGNLASRSLFDCRNAAPVIIAAYGSARPRPTLRVVQQESAWGTLVDATEWSNDSLYNLQFYSLEFRCPACTRASNGGAAFFMNHQNSAEITFYDVRIDGFAIGIQGSSPGVRLLNSQITNNISQGILGALPRLSVRGSLFENNGCRFLPKGSSECIFEHALYQICAPSGEVPECDDDDSGIEYIGNLLLNNSISGSGTDLECGGSNIVGLIGNGLRFESNVVATTLPINGNCFFANSGPHSWPGTEECRDCRFNNNVMLNPSVGFDLRSTRNAQVNNNLFIFSAPSLNGNTTAISAATTSSGTSISGNLVRFVVPAPDWVTTGIILEDGGSATNNTFIDTPASPACETQLAAAGDSRSYSLPTDPALVLAACRE